MKTTSVNPPMSFTFGYFFTRNLPENQGLLTRNLPDESETFPASVPLAVLRPPEGGLIELDVL